MSAVAPASRPAEQLQGVTLSSGWLVQTRIVKPAGHTGSAFGVGYLVEKGGNTAFMKAIDFVHAMSAADPIAEL